MDKYPKFLASLKISNEARFKFFKYLYCTHTLVDHLRHEDQVLGFWYYDIKMKCFKHDFVVNLGEKHNHYLSFVPGRLFPKLATSKEERSYIQSLDHFRRIYCNGTNYYHDGTKLQHKYWSIDELPPDEELRRRAKILRSRYT